MSTIDESRNEYEDNLIVRSGTFEFCGGTSFSDRRRCGILTEGKIDIRVVEKGKREAVGDVVSAAARERSLSKDFMVVSD